MVVWRIDQQRRAATAATGEGARLVGARWNSPGHAAVYTAGHLSLAVLEILVHAATAEQRQVSRVKFRISVDDASITRCDPAQLPPDFGPQTPSRATQVIGDEWLRAKTSVGLLVPSAIVPEEQNLILNPLHPDFARLAIWGQPDPVTLDPRLWRV
jgi:RES domain-containing protein